MREGLRFFFFFGCWLCICTHVHSAPYSNQRGKKKKDLKGIFILSEAKGRTRRRKSPRCKGQPFFFPRTARKRTRHRQKGKKAKRQKLRKPIDGRGVCSGGDKKKFAKEEIAHYLAETGFDPVSSGL
jgi:hypothetical protein